MVFGGCVGGFLVTLQSKRHFCPAKLPVALSYSGQGVSYTVLVQKCRWNVRNKVTVLHHTAQHCWCPLSLWSYEGIKLKQIRVTTSKENKVWLSISAFPRLGLIGFVPNSALPRSRRDAVGLHSLDVKKSPKSSYFNSVLIWWDSPQFFVLFGFSLLASCSE